MIKKIINLVIIVLLISFVFGCENTPQTDKLTDDNIIETIKSKSLYEIEFSNLLENIAIEYELPKDDLIIIDFNISITKEFKVRVFTINFESQINKVRYKVIYSREMNRIMVSQIESNNFVEGIQYNVFGQKFDEIKKVLEYQNNDNNYLYYSINLYGLNISLENMEVFKIDKNEEHSKNVEGTIVFMIYGEPILKEDSPMFYGIEY